MNEQIYYTYSTQGSGSTTGERFRAYSPELGSPTQDPLRSLRRYLSYRLPAGTNQISLETAPISLSLVKADPVVVLVHKVCAGKDGVGRPGNFFSHAIVDPGVRSAQTGEFSPLSAFHAINLWKSPFWRTSEDQISTRETTLPCLTSQEIGQLVATTSPAMLALRQPYPDIPHGLQTAADWLAQVFSAFLMLEKLNKKQLYIAAPAEMVATLIWCIARCLPQTLSVMQDFTFNTYENEIAKTAVTMTGTCWLPPANHTGPFTPQADLPNACYLSQPTNLVLAINCYTQKQTPFNIDEQVKDFVQFATQSLLQNDMTDLDTLIGQATQKRCQNMNDFLELFRILQEPPTSQTVREILANPQRRSYLQFTKIQDEFIHFLSYEKEGPEWWMTQGQKQMKSMRDHALKQPGGDEAIALRTLASKVISELHNDLTANRQDWTFFWNELLNDISSPSTDLDVWVILPRNLSGLPYTDAYLVWWQRSGQKIVQELYQIASSNIPLRETPQLIEALGIWFQKCIVQMKQAWGQKQEVEMSLWLDILSTIRPPAKGDQDWYRLLSDLDGVLPQINNPVRWCKWDIFKQLLIAWHMVLTPQQLLPRRWLTLAWDTLPRLLAVSDLPEEWLKVALEDRIRQYRGQSSDQMPPIADVARCAPRVHKVLADLIQREHEREQAVRFCESLLQQNYTLRDDLLLSILPILLPYPDYTNRIAAVAHLTPEQLNDFLEGTLHTMLVSQQTVPPWLLENYLTLFRVQTVNPDNKQVTPERRERICAILSILKQYKPVWSDHLHPYISCWSLINDFFTQPVFDLKVMRTLKQEIKYIKLGEAQRNELNRDMIAFLSQHVETDLDIQRVIDNFGDLLFYVQKRDIPEHVSLLKEMADVYGRASYSQQRTNAYIKVVLSEAIKLLASGISKTKQTEFVHESLNSLFISGDTSQFVHTLGWPPTFMDLWDGYLRRTKTPNSSTLTNVSTSTVGQSGKLAAQQSGTLPDKSSQRQDHASYYSTRPNTQVSPANNAGQQSIATNDRSKSGLLSGISNRFNKSDNFESKLTTLQEAIASKKVEKIADAYDESLDGYLSKSQANIAKMAEEIVKSHKKIKAIKNINAFEASKDGQYFIKTYNKYYKEFIISDDIKKTVNWVISEQEKRDKK